MKIVTLLRTIALGAAFSAGGILYADKMSLLVPRPNSLEEIREESFQLKRDTIITHESAEDRETAALLAELLQQRTGCIFKVKEASSALKNTIHLCRNAESDKIAQEGYNLQVVRSGIRLSAAGPAGLFYAVQTVCQLLPVDKKLTLPVEIDGVKISDKPAFSWRGMMLDVSRYWFNKDFVLKYIDLMAMHKMNMLHWHLIDDAGWRIEIKKYPKLTEVGGFRGKGENRYGGFYTQDDIREIVAYAQARNVTIIPEVEIPAHTLAAVVAYPYLCCTGKQMEVPTKHFISRDLYCAGKESTWTFLEDVMDEVCDLFPGKWVHIGGDEAKYDRWKECSLCQSKKQELGLESEKQIQGWMTCRIEKYLQKKGKQIIGWDEILGTGISDKAGIMTWHRPKTAVEGAKRGNKVVMSLTGHAYFDTAESNHIDEPPAASWIPPISLKKAYSWDPVPTDLPMEVRNNILGANGCVWTDQFLHNATALADKKGQGAVASERYVEYLSLPRMAALAEVVWTRKELRNWDQFQARMGRMYSRYSNSGYNYRLPMPEVISEKQPDGTYSVTASTTVEGATLHYTTDKSLPTPASPELSGAVTVESMDDIRIRTVAADGLVMSLATTNSREIPQKLRRYGTCIGEWESGKIAADTSEEFVFDVTGKINENRKYTLSFCYTGGKNKLSVAGVEVIKNDGAVVCEDSKHIEVHKRRRVQHFALKIENYETGASFKVRARLNGVKGKDSSGLLFIK